MRLSPGLRRLVRETALAADDLVFPLFVRHGEGLRQPIASMPGNAQLSVDELLREIEPLLPLGLNSVMLFGIPETKDASGTENYAERGIVQQAIRALTREFPDLVVMTDICMCEYTNHGHCGLLHDWPSTSLSSSEGGESRRGFGLPPKSGTRTLPSGYVLNDETLELLGRVAVSHAEAGATLVAPSAMMDGQVAAIRRALDKAGFEHLPIMAYAAKFASGFYGPFRDAAESPPSFGDRSQYQMDPANRREALREVELDALEGADILMVKPALPYLDVIRDVREQFPHPIAAYNVSGEFAMVKAAAANGWLDERRVVLEALTGIKRAGADIILSYHTPDVLRWLKG
ncbi:MAG TPA: porphobilinogen synthase [Chloroflexi bacterium]|nr:porphobilinogen synthase [Chloroflexota bacterium]